MQRLITHKTGDRGLTNLLCDNDDVPVVKLMRDVLDRVFSAIFAPGQQPHIIFVKLNVDFGETIHYFDKENNT